MIIIIHYKGGIVAGTAEPELSKAQSTVSSSKHWSTGPHSPREMALPLGSHETERSVLQAFVILS